MNKQWWIPLIIVIAFGIESIVPNFLPVYFFSQYVIIVPRILFIVLLFITVFYDEKQGQLYAFLSGVVMDIVFTEIIGIYIFWYPATIYLVRKVMKYWHNNLFVTGLVAFIAVTFLETGIFWIHAILNTVDVPFKYFVEHRLIPTLIFNFIIYLVFSYPLKKRLVKLAKMKSEESMFQS